LNENADARAGQRDYAGRPRAIIFDLGHTLWDIGPHTPALEHAYDDLHAALIAQPGLDVVPDARTIQRAVHDVLMESAETYFGAASDIARLEQPPSHTWLDAGLRRIEVELDEPLLRELTPPLFCTEYEALVCHDGTIEALHALAAEGYALGCVTNTLADEAGIRRMLRKFDAENLMASVVVSTEIGVRKPHPSLFQTVAADLGVQTREAVFVGDSPWHDIAGAQAVGMLAVQTTQYATRPPLDGVTPDATIAHLRELLAVVPTLRRASV
jgi:HAD superfamily hydrolase (TIGR01509 family)